MRFLARRGTEEDDHTESSVSSNIHRAKDKQAIETPGHRPSRISATVDDCRKSIVPKNPPHGMSLEIAGAKD